jgi:predicted DNA-binding transcriptional regulator AlpA
MHDESERLITRSGVAAMFGCSPASVDRYEGQGIIPTRRQLSTGRVGWLYSECVAAMRSLPAGPIAGRAAAAREAQRVARERAKAGAPEAA